MFNLKGYLIVAAIVALSAFGGGWKAASTYYQVKLQRVQLADERAKVKALEDNLALIRETLEADGKTAEEDLAAINKLKETAREAVDQSTDRPALDGDAVDRLRRVFQK